MALVAASLSPRTRSSTTSAGMVAPGSSCKLVRTARRRPARQVGEPATETYSYCPLPALRPSCPGGGSCRPGWYSSVTVREWRRRGASPAAPRGGARQPPPSWPAPSRAMPPLIVPLVRHSRSSSAASGPVPCSRYCRSLRL
jgi:hypothetical protein